MFTNHEKNGTKNVHIIFLHLAPHTVGSVSFHNNLAGDAIVDGKTIQWEYHKKIEGMTSDEITSMTMKEYERHERDRMERNAWLVAHDLGNRLDSAQQFYSWLVSQKSEDHFFFNKEELRAFNNTSSSTNKNLPGSAYFEKINAFIGNHVYGELFMEYLKGACETSTGQLCDFCANTPWVGPHMNRIPQPIPDYAKLPSYHYMSVFNTPINTDAGLPQEPDDYMP